MTVLERAPAVRGAALLKGGARYRRLVIDRPELSIVLDLHPAITVAHLRRGDVDAAAGLAAGALDGDEPGVHVELTDAEGRELVVFRPHGGRARIVDVVDQVEAAPPPPVAPTGTADVLRRLAAIEPAEMVEAVDRLFAAVEAEGFRELARRDRGGRRSRRARERADREAAEAAAVDAAGAAWGALLPEVGVAWVVEHTAEVSACAEAARRAGALRALGDGGLDAAAVVAAVAEVVASPAERPHVLVLPRAGLGAAETDLLLDLLPELCRGQQLLIVTASLRVAGWARLEALAGRAAVVEPGVVIGAV